MIFSDKSSFRNHCLSILDVISHREKRSLELLDMIRRKVVFKDISVVSVFISLGSEPSTAPIITYLWKEGLHVVVPEISDNGNDDFLKFREFLPKIPLSKSSFGVSYPSSGKLYSVEELDLVFVPGLAFSREGYRLGRGMGFYDRLLSLYKGLSIGLCFEELIFDSVPTEKHDQKVDHVFVC